MTISKEAPKLDLNFDSSEDTFKLLGDPVNRDSLNFSFDSGAAVSRPTSPTSTNTAPVDLAQLESPVTGGDCRRSTLDPLAIAEHQLSLQREQEQQQQQQQQEEQQQKQQNEDEQAEKGTDPRGLKGGGAASTGGGTIDHRRTTTTTNSITAGHGPCNYY